MSDQQPGIGFVMPQQQHQQPYYPPQPPSYPTANQQQGYPAAIQQPPSYPAPNQQHGYPAPAYQQPTPLGPIQHQPNIYDPHNKLASEWGKNSAFEHYLRNANSLHVAQKLELLEAFIGWESNNKYVVKDQAGNKLFYAIEESGCCTRQCCGAARNFTLNIRDVSGRDVMIIDRPLNFSCFCGLLFPDTITVSDPGGQVLGYVVQDFSLLYPRFKLKDAIGRTVLKIEGPFWTTSCFGKVNFEITDKTGNSVGQIAKQWSGFVREFFTDADYFTATFPVQLDIPMKAVCLAALFLIDYEYFEDSAHGRTNSIGTSLGENISRALFH